MEILAGIFVMLVTTIGNLAPQANIPQVLGVATTSPAQVTPAVLAETSTFSSPLPLDKSERMSQFQQNARTRREQVKQNIVKRREEAQQKIETRKTELRAKLAQLKDTRKQTLVENIVESVNTKNDRWVNHWTVVLDRLTEILAKIESRAARAQEDGKDTTKVQAAISTAKTAIADAQSAVNGQAAKVYSINITSESNVRSDVQKVIEQFKADLRTVHSSVTKARQSVVSAVRLLGMLLDEEGSNVSE